MNTLFPIFLKANELDILLVGGGPVAAEKLHFLLKSSPKAKVKVVSKEICEETKLLITRHNLPYELRAVAEDDIINTDVIIGATNSTETNAWLKSYSKKYRRLLNIADTPALCDFYLSAVVTKGDLKIAISTNGQSPTIAKRLREYLEAEIPEELDELLQTLQNYRTILPKDFAAKVNALNEHTKHLLEARS